MGRVAAHHASLQGQADGAARYLALALMFALVALLIRVKL